MKQFMILLILFMPCFVNSQVTQTEWDSNYGFTFSGLFPDYGKLNNSLEGSGYPSFNDQNIYIGLFYNTPTYRAYNSKNEKISGWLFEHFYVNINPFYQFFPLTNRNFITKKQSSINSAGIGLEPSLRFYLSRNIRFNMMIGVSFLWEWLDLSENVPSGKQFGEFLNSDISSYKFSRYGTNLSFGLGFDFIPVSNVLTQNIDGVEYKTDSGMLVSVFLKYYTAFLQTYTGDNNNSWLTDYNSQVTIDDNFPSGIMLDLKLGFNSITKKKRIKH